MTDARSPHTASAYEETASARHTRALVFGVVIFAAALAGIWARPSDYVSVFWPANALALGLMLRDSRNAKPLCWVAVSVGFVAADVLTGAHWDKALWLTLANLCGIATGWATFRKMPGAVLRMRRQSSALMLFICCVLASLASTVLGTWAVVTLFHTPPAVAATLWVSSELMNYVLILPVVMTFPHKDWQDPQPHALTRGSFMHIAPLLSVVAAEIGAFILGGARRFSFHDPSTLVVRTDIQRVYNRCTRPRCLRLENDCGFARCF